MLVINNALAMARALDSPLEASLKRLLILRRDQLLEYPDHDLSELACFIVAEPGDTIAQIEAEARMPLVSAPAFEWVQDHDGWLEAPTIVSDDGFGIVLLVPNHRNIDPALLSALRLQLEAETVAKS